MNETEFARMMVWLAAAFPNQALPAATQEAYWNALHDIPADVGMAAALKVAAEMEFCSIAALRKAATSLHPKVQGLPTPYEAWESTLRALRMGAGHPVVQAEAMVHPLVERAVLSIGGWMRLAMSDNEVADRARFLESYKMLAERAFEDVNTPAEVKALAERMSVKALPGARLALPKGNGT